MTTRFQQMCGWAGPTFLVLYGIFFWGIAGWIPPQSPSWSAARVDEYYADHTDEIRIGQIGAMIVSVLMFPFWAVIIGHVARIERNLGRPAILAVALFGGAMLLQVFFVCPSMCWLVATYRAELDESTVRMLHDFGWLMFVMVFPGYTLALICIGIAALSDTSEDPIFPRWLGYFNIWVALSAAGGGIAVFFKDGAFAWNGFLAFYLPVVCFVAWIGTMTFAMHNWFKRQAGHGIPLSELQGSASSEGHHVR